MTGNHALTTNDTLSLESNTPLAMATQHARPRGPFSAVARSPFFMMPLWIIGSTTLYLLGWSNLFAPIRPDMALFLVAACALFLALSLLVSSQPSTERGLPVNWWAIGLITAYFVGAFVKGGGIPILQIVFGQGYDVYGFGVNGLHIFMLAFAGYYGVRACKAFIDRNQLQDLMALIWIFVLFGSIANRSAVSFLVFACAILFFRSRRFSWQIWVGLVVALLLFAYAFGVFGDIRLAFQIEQESGVIGAPDAVLRLARANDAFHETGLAPTWLWAYLYFVSPLANLNEAFAYAAANPCAPHCNVGALVFFDLMPDAIGTRIAAVFNVQDFSKSEFLIAPDITASTSFGSAVGLAGTAGGVAVLIAIAAVCWASIRLLEGSPVREEGLAILATIVFFSFFENMIAYTALFGQLCIVIARALIARSRWRV